MGLPSHGEESIRDSEFAWQLTYDVSQEIFHSETVQWDKILSGRNSATILETLKASVCDRPHIMRSFGQNKGALFQVCKLVRRYLL